MSAQDAKRTHLVVGAGRMGGALLSGWLETKRTRPMAENLVIIDPAPGEAAKAAIHAGALHLKDLGKAGQEPLFADIKCVLLAVKPQMFEKIAPQIEPLLPQDILIISILAGTNLNSLRQAFPKRRIIRAMTNTPAAIGAGITAIAKNGEAKRADYQIAERLLSVGGDVFTVENENMIDMVTAISGSGPAYVFYLVESLTAAAVQIGFPPDLAPVFARQTIIGAGELLSKNETDAITLRRNVTSPGGTTQAALDVLMAEPGMASLMRNAVQAALRRARELAQN